MTTIAAGLEDLRHRYDMTMVKRAYEDRGVMRH